MSKTEKGGKAHHQPPPPPMRRPEHMKGGGVVKSGRKIPKVSDVPTDYAVPISEDDVPVPVFLEEQMYDLNRSVEKFRAELTAATTATTVVAAEYDGDSLSMSKAKAKISSSSSGVLDEKNRFVLRSSPTANIMCRGETTSAAASMSTAAAAASSRQQSPATTSLPTGRSTSRNHSSRVTLDSAGRVREKMSQLPITDAIMLRLMAFYKTVHGYNLRVHEEMSRNLGINVADLAYVETELSREIRLSTGFAFIGTSQFPPVMVLTLVLFTFTEEDTAELFCLKADGAEIADAGSSNARTSALRTMLLAKIKEAQRRSHTSQDDFEPGSVRSLIPLRSALLSGDERVLSRWVGTASVLLSALYFLPKLIYEQQQKQPIESSSFVDGESGGTRPSSFKHRVYHEPRLGTLHDDEIAAASLTAPSSAAPSGGKGGGKKSRPPSAPPNTTPPPPLSEGDPATRDLGPYIGCTMKFQLDSTGEALGVLEQLGGVEIDESTAPPPLFPLAQSSSSCSAALVPTGQLKHVEGYVPPISYEVDEENYYRGAKEKANLLCAEEHWWIQPIERPPVDETQMSKKQLETYRASVEEEKAYLAALPTAVTLDVITPTRFAAPLHLFSRHPDIKEYVLSPFPDCRVELVAPSVLKLVMKCVGLRDNDSLALDFYAFLGRVVTDATKASMVAGKISTRLVEQFVKPHHCHRHPMQKYSQFCHVCKKFICSACTGEQHMTHSYVPVAAFCVDESIRLEPKVQVLTKRLAVLRQLRDSVGTAEQQMHELVNSGINDVVSRLEERRVVLRSDAEERAVKLRAQLDREYQNCLKDKVAISDAMAVVQEYKLGKDVTIPNVKLHERWQVHNLLILQLPTPQLKKLVQLLTWSNPSKYLKSFIYPPQGLGAGAEKDIVVTGTTTATAATKNKQQQLQMKK